MRVRRAARRGEEGFTLIELLVTVVIVGIIVTGLAGVIISYLKVTVASQSRITESQDVQFAAAYWQRDVASIGVRTYDSTSKSFNLAQSVDVTLPSGCTLPSGTRVVTLAWSRYDTTVSTDSPTLVTVSYVAQATGSTYRLLRVRCTGGSVSSTVTVSRTLRAVPTVACDVSCTGTGANVPNVVSLSLSVLDPENRGSTTQYDMTLSGERRQT